MSSIGLQRVVAVMLWATLLVPKIDFAWLRGTAWKAIGSNAVIVASDDDQSTFQLVASDGSEGNRLEHKAPAKWRGKCETYSLAAAGDSSAHISLSCRDTFIHWEGYAARPIRGPPGADHYWFS